MDRKKIIKMLFVAVASRIGGGEKVLLDIVDKISKDKFFPVVILPAKGEISNALQERGVKFDIVKLDSEYSKLWPFPFICLVLRFVFLIIKEDISLIHVNGLNGYRAISVAAFLTRRKIICHLHYPPSQEDLRYSLLVYPDCLLCCCDDIKRNILKMKRYPEAKIIALPNGIDVNKFYPEQKPEKFKFELGLNISDFIITTIGDLSERKGQIAFIEMAKGVLASHPECTFLIIGKEKKSDTGYEKKLKDYAYSLGISEKIKFINFTDKVRAHLMATDIMVLASLEEGLPLVILEAMACGKPVVTTNVNGIPEAVKDGVNGFLVKPKDVNGMVSYVVKLLSDEGLRLKMGQAGRSRVVNEFSIELYYEKLQNIYLRILNSNVKDY